MLLMGKPTLFQSNRTKYKLITGCNYKCYQPVPPIVSLSLPKPLKVNVNQSNRALERRTTYMNVSWQSNLVASQKNMLEYPAKARSAIVNAMP